MDNHHVASNLHAVCLRIIDSGFNFLLEVVDPAVLAKSVAAFKSVRVILVKLLVANCTQLVIIILK